MPQPQTPKNYFQLNLGLNTENNEITAEDGYTTDESDFELLVDGSRRRRKGLDQEDNGSNLNLVTTLTGTEHSDAFLWRNVGGDDTVRFWVHRVGEYLYFSSDDDTPSDSWETDTVNLAAYAANGSSIQNQPVTMAQGKGDLLVAGEGLVSPLRISYDSSTPAFDVEPIEIKIRDYSTIDDGIAVNEHPAIDSGRTLADLAGDYPDHYYNLINRGWQNDDLVAYADTTGNGGRDEWPSRHEVWFRGYKLVTTTDFDGPKEFDPDTLAGTPFALSSAPTGSMVLRVADDTIGFRTGIPTSSGAYVTDTTPLVSESSGTITVTLEEASHGRANGSDVFLKVCWLVYTNTSGGISAINLGDEVVQIADNDPNSDGDFFTFTLTTPSDYSSNIQFNPLISFASWFNNPEYTRSSGTGPLTVGPKAVEFHQGRAWFAGIPDAAWSNYIFYSQIVQTDKEFDKCYTEADPTDPFISQSVPTDGGYLALPGIGNIIRLVSHRDGLFVFSDEGVWEISGGRDAILTPDNIQIRKVTDVEADSPYGIRRVEDSIIYTGPKGIMLIAPNQYTSLMEATNISDERIRTLWNNIEPSFRKRVQTVYDDARKRLYFLHGGSSNKGEATGNTSNSVRHKATFLIFDMRVNAWYKWFFESNSTNGCLYAFTVSGADVSDTNKKLKVACQTNASVVQICDFDQSNYEDFYNSGNEASIPYMYTGWDNVGDHQRRRQAPIVTVYNKKTATGYTSTGNGWEPVNPASVKMTALWDWTDDAISGKIYGPIQTYRNVRNFVPSGASDEDGYPVVVTRNKVRGRGRALQLKFEGEEGYDTHILGFTINYKVSRRI